MEGVGARLGRSSTRYGGPATVFTGPVRKWKKKWVPITNPNNNNHNHNNNSSTNNNDPSAVLLFKWTPIPNSPLPDQEQPPRKRFRYIPVAVLEEEKEEEKEEEDGAVDVMKIDDDDDEEEDDDDDEEEVEKKNEGGDDDVLAAAEGEAATRMTNTTVGEGAEEKAADVSDVKDEAQVSDKDEAQAVNRTSLDLNLGLKSRDGDSGSDRKMEEQDEASNDQMERDDLR